jgi:hypothetical protein
MVLGSDHRGLISADAAVRVTHVGDCAPTRADNLDRLAGSPHNASTRSGDTKYRPATAQSHAEPAAGRSEQGKLVGSGIANLCGGMTGWRRHGSK